MSRTRRNGTKPPGYDFWSRRHPASAILGYGLYAKQLTHRYERRQGKREIRSQLSDLEMRDSAEK